MSDKPLFKAGKAIKADATKPVEDKDAKPVAPASEVVADTPPVEDAAADEAPPSQETGDDLSSVPEDMLEMLTTPGAQNLDAAELAAISGQQEVHLQGATPPRVAQPVYPPNSGLEEMMQKRAELDRAMAELDDQIANEERAAGSFVFTFVAKNPSQVVYVTTNKGEMRCNFVNGLFSTTDQAVASHLQELPLYKRGGIRQQTNARLAHLRGKMARERQTLRGGTAAGITGSTAGADASFTQRDTQLAQMEQRLL